MALENRSLKTFPSLNGNDALNGRAIIWHVFCHVQTAIWCSLTWLHPVSLLHMIWGFHLGIYRAIPAVTSVLYPRRRRLLTWIRSQVPSQEVNDLASVWQNGALLCALVEAAVAPDPQLGCRFGKYRCSAVPSMRLGQKLAAEYLRVNPEFSEDELESDLTPAILSRLVDYLSALQHAATLLKEGCEGAQVQEVNPEVTARGMGLVMAVQGRRATFSIFPLHRRALFTSHFDSVLVQIRGPHGDTGSVLVTQYSTQAHHTAGGLVQIIPIHVTVYLESARITYTPQSSGHHELTLMFLGNHIANSPHLVSVEPRGIHTDLNIIPRTVASTTPVLTRIVDFVTEKRILTDDGRLVEIVPPKVPGCAITRQLSLRKRTKHVMAKRKVIGRRKLGNQSIKSIEEVEKVSDRPPQNEVKIIIHEIEDKRRKSVTPPLKTDFKDSCKRILWICDLLLKNSNKDKGLNILNTAEQILSTGKETSLRDVATASPLSEQALCRLRGHLHANDGGLNDVDMLKQESSKPVILKDVTKHDDLKVKTENFIINSLPMSPIKNEPTTLPRRSSEPIEISRDKCGFQELDNIVYSDYCIVSFSPIKEVSSRNSNVSDLDALDIKNEILNKDTLAVKPGIENLEIESEQKELSIRESIHQENQEISKEMNSKHKTQKEEQTLLNNSITEIISTFSNTNPPNVSKDSKEKPLTTKEEVENNVAYNNTKLDSEVKCKELESNESLERGSKIKKDNLPDILKVDSNLVGNVALENYESILQTTNLEDALNIFENAGVFNNKLIEDENKIKVKDWMGPAEKEIWDNELEWYKSETLGDDVFESEIEIQPTEDISLDVQTCFEDCNSKLSETYLEENKELLEKEISSRRLRFKKTKTSGDNKIEENNEVSPSIVEDINSEESIKESTISKADLRDATNNTKEVNIIEKDDSRSNIQATGDITISSDNKQFPTSDNLLYIESNKLIITEESTKINTDCVLSEKLIIEDTSENTNALTTVHEFEDSETIAIVKNFTTSIFVSPSHSAISKVSDVDALMDDIESDLENNQTLASEGNTNSKELKVTDVKTNEIDQRETNNEKLIVKNEQISNFYDNNEKSIINDCKKEIDNTKSDKFTNTNVLENVMDDKNTDAAILLAETEHTLSSPEIECNRTLLREEYIESKPLSSIAEFEYIKSEDIVSNSNPETKEIPSVENKTEDKIIFKQADVDANQLEIKVKEKYSTNYTNKETEDQTIKTETLENLDDIQKPLDHFLENENKSEDKNLAGYTSPLNFIENKINSIENIPELVQERHETELCENIIIKTETSEIKENENEIQGEKPEVISEIPEIIDIQSVVPEIHNIKCFENIDYNEPLSAETVDEIFNNVICSEKIDSISSEKSEESLKQFEDIYQESIDDIDSELVQELFPENVTSEDDTIVQVTRRLSLSLRRLSVQTDSLVLPEYFQLLSHSPDIQSIGTPDKSNQLTPNPELDDEDISKSQISSDIVQKDDSVNILNEEDNLTEFVDIISKKETVIPDLSKIQETVVAKLEQHQYEQNLSVLIENEEVIDNKQGNISDVKLLSDSSFHEEKLWESSSEFSNIACLESVNSLGLGIKIADKPSTEISNEIITDKLIDLYVHEVIPDLQIQYDDLPQIENITKSILPIHQDITLCNEILDNISPTNADVNEHEKIISNLDIKSINVTECSKKKVDENLFSINQHNIQDKTEIHNDENVIDITIPNIFVSSKNENKTEAPETLLEIKDLKITESAEIITNAETKTNSEVSETVLEDCKQEIKGKVLEMSFDSPHIQESSVLTTQSCSEQKDNNSLLSSDLLITQGSSKYISLEIIPSNTSEICDSTDNIDKINSFALLKTQNNIEELDTLHSLKNINIDIEKADDNHLFEIKSIILDDISEYKNSNSKVNENQILIDTSVENSDKYQSEKVLTKENSVDSLTSLMENIEREKDKYYEDLDKQVLKRVENATEDFTVQSKEICDSILLPKIQRDSLEHDKEKDLIEIEQLDVQNPEKYKQKENVDRIGIKKDNESIQRNSEEIKKKISSFDHIENSQKRLSIDNKGIKDKHIIDLVSSISLDGTNRKIKKQIPVMNTSDSILSKIYKESQINQGIKKERRVIGVVGIDDYEKPETEILKKTETEILKKRKTISPVNQIEMDLDKFYEELENTHQNEGLKQNITRKENQGKCLENILFSENDETIYDEEEKSPMDVNTGNKIDSQSGNTDKHLERRDSLVAKQKSFWDEKILSIDEETVPIKIVPTPRYLPKSPSIKAEGIVAKSLQCFQPNSDGFYHAKRAWATPTMTPEPDNPPPDLIASQPFKQAPEIIPRNLQKGKKLSVFENENIQSTLSEIKSIFDKPDLINTKNVQETSKIPENSPKKLQTPKPLPRKSIRQFEDESILTSNKGNKKFSYESEKFFRKKEENQTSDLDQVSHDKKTRKDSFILHKKSIFEDKSENNLVKSPLNTFTCKDSVREKRIAIFQQACLSQKREGTELSEMNFENNSPVKKKVSIFEKSNSLEFKKGNSVLPQSKEKSNYDAISPNYRSLISPERNVSSASCRTGIKEYTQKIEATDFGNYNTQKRYISPTERKKSTALDTKLRNIDNPIVYSEKIAETVVLSPKKYVSVTERKRSIATSDDNKKEKEILLNSPERKEVMSKYIAKYEGTLYRKSSSLGTKSGTLAIKDIISEEENVDKSKFLAKDLFKNSEIEIKKPSQLNPRSGMTVKTDMENISNDTNQTLIVQKDKILPVKNDENIKDEVLLARKGSVMLTKTLLDHNATKSKSGAQDGALFHTVQYKTGRASIAIVPPREPSIDKESGIPRRKMSLLKMFSIEVTPSLEIETSFVNPLCDLNADDEATTSPKQIPLPKSMRNDGETKDRFDRAKNFFKNLETTDTVTSAEVKVRGSSLGRLRGQKISASQPRNDLKFCSERQTKFVERFHVKDLFRDVENKKVGGRGIPHTQAVVASLNAAVSQQVAPSPYDLTREDEEPKSLEMTENTAEETLDLEPEANGLQRRGSLERHLNYKRLSRERTTAEMF